MKVWHPEFDTYERKVHYLAHLQCGFCDAPTAVMIAGVGLCASHRQRVTEIVDRPMPEEGWLQRATRRRKAPRATATCRCGITFSYPKGRGQRTWCSACVRLGTTTEERERKLAKRQRDAAKAQVRSA